MPPIQTDVSESFPTYSLINMETKPTIKHRSYSLNHAIELHHLIQARYSPSLKYRGRSNLTNNCVWWPAGICLSSCVWGRRGGGRRGTDCENFHSKHIWKCSFKTWVSCFLNSARGFGKFWILPHNIVKRHAQDKCYACNKSKHFAFTVIIDPM